MRRNISLPDELDAKLQDYCDRNGFSVSALIKHLVTLKIDFEYGPKVPEPYDPIEANKQVLEDIPEDPIATVPPVEWQPWPKSGKPKTAPKKSASRSDLCPHFIAKTGYCKECNG